LGAAVASDESLRLAECLCARLCHEMAGALGALMGSLDLAREDEAMAGDAMALASQTGHALVARLRLLRAAWVGDGMPLGLARLAELAGGLADRRIELDLAALAPATLFDPAVGRVVLNLVLLGAEALPTGGTVWLERVERELVLGVTGPRVEWPPGLAASLAGEAAIEGPRGMQAPLTVLLARAAGLDLSLMMPAGGIRGAGAALLMLGLPRDGGTGRGTGSSVLP
jgi:histidine phosphotransferase ChpT